MPMTDTPALTTMPTFSPADRPLDCLGAIVGVVEEEDILVLLGIAGVDVVVKEDVNAVLTDEEAEESKAWVLAVYAGPTVVAAARCVMS